MDEKALLEAIRSIVREEIQAEITPIRVDIATLKQGQAKLEQGQDKLEQGQDKLEQGQDKLEQGQDNLEQGQADLQESLQTVKKSQIQVELIHLPKITAALDGHKLNSEKLDAIQRNLEDITPTVQALEILHETGYAK